jgi:hypothetical protein
MVNTRKGRDGAESSQENGNPLPPPSLAQAITSIIESRDEQTELLRQLVANSARGDNGASYIIILSLSLGPRNKACIM